MLRVLYSCAYFQNYWEETFFNKNWQVFHCCSTATCDNNSCRITFFGSFYHPIHFTRFYLLRFNKSFPILSMALRLIHFSIHVLILSSNIFVGSPFKRVNGLLFIWYWNLILFIVNKTNLEPLSWTLIVWSSKERGSCEYFRSLAERLLQILW